MIHVTERGRVVRLALDAPPVNVLDTALLSELAASLRQLARRDDLAAVLLEGAGRCFSAGASVAEHRPETVAAMLQALDDAGAALAALPVPAVALVHGSCLGGALELVASCDFVVADPAATFGQPEIRLAFFPPVASVQLPRLIGRQNAAYLILTGDAVPAERALAMGLVQKLVARDQWGEVEELFNALSAPAVRLAKRALAEVASGEVASSLARAEELFLTDLYRLDDVAEGIASFAEKRKPVWRQR